MALSLDPWTSSAVALDDASGIGEARRTAGELATREGFDDTVAGRAALVATELATNLVKHGGGGHLLLRSEPEAVEILAVDRGRGIGDIASALRDGFSTAGSPGTGLGAVRRVADAFDLYTLPGAGTVAFASVRPRGASPAQPALGVVSLPVVREDVSGDAWAVERRGPALRLLAIDGLGHGAVAATAARAGVKDFRRLDGTSTLDAVITALHAALHPTRGAAVAVADLDPARRRVTFAGVGNLTGTICGAARSRSMVSLAGTLGHGRLRARTFDYPWEPGDPIVIASDGLATRWRLESYPGLAARHPAVIAGVLWRDHARSHDDVTVIVIGEHRGEEPAA